MADPAQSITGLYEATADAYDRLRGRSLFEAPWLDRFLALLPTASATILDIGCGSAEPLARYMIEAGHAVTGVDSSPSLIAMCRRRFPAHHWQVGDMRTLALGRRFHGLLAWDSLFHLTPQDQRGMFARFHAHAMAGCALMFTSGPGHGEAIGCFEGRPLYHGSLDAAEYQTLLDASGFDVVAHVVEDPACGGHTIWLARAR